MIPSERIAEMMVDIADTLIEDFDVMMFLHRLTSHATEFAEAAEVGIMVTDKDGDLRFVAASQELAETLEIFQLQTGEGPCLDAFNFGHAVTNVDLATASQRWPRFAPRAAAAGFEVVHALPMRLRDEVIGGLNVFTAHGRTVGEAELKILQAMANLATIGLLQLRAAERAATLAGQLQTALQSRVLIEQAKGALAQLHSLDMEAAFRLLRNYARSHHYNLTDLARDCLAEPDQFPELTSPPLPHRSRRH